MSNSLEKRGVENHRIIDLIRLDAATDRVVMHMIELRSWSGGDAQLNEIQNKFNSYLGYVLDGFLAKQFPHYAGKLARFVLECAEKPSGRAESFVEAMISYAVAQNIDFDVRLLTEDEVKKYRAEFEANAYKEVL